MPDFVPSYPVHVRGRVDADLSRWLWLVKWLLAIPHLLVLSLLWLAVVVLTIVAGVSIVFTGRYPRSIFDFSVGVMRWTWRVQFYAFTLGTDRYPPFSLRPQAEYPADLDVDYPERLSRRLVWVKSWLLAIPHLLVVGVFVGGWYVADARLTGGLAGLLALFAGIVLAAGRRYPDSMFAFAMGMWRWIWRVAAYVALMRDEYPPFRLDMGSDEPPPETSLVAPPMAA
jgi:hypothetical protein